MAIAFEHLTADVPREGFNGLFADAWILCEPRDERVPHIVRPVAHASGFTGEPPCVAPGTHWTAEINVVKHGQTRVSAHPYFVEREEQTVRPGTGEAFLPDWARNSQRQRQQNFVLLQRCNRNCPLRV